MILYHDDFTTPGSSPFSASPRKQMRQIPNLRMYPLGRPQFLQRLCLRDENLGFLASFTRFAVVAIPRLLPSYGILESSPAKPGPGPTSGLDLSVFMDQFARLETCTNRIRGLKSAVLQRTQRPAT